MSKRLFVGGLSWGTDDAALRQAFAVHGEVTDAKVISDRDTGRSRGFGFVTFGTEEAAKAAMDAMQGTEIDGRTIRIDEARERQGFGGGGGGGEGRGFGRPGGGPRRDGPSRGPRGRGSWGERD